MKSGRRSYLFLIRLVGLNDTTNNARCAAEFCDFPIYGGIRNR